MRLAKELCGSDDPALAEALTYFTNMVQAREKKIGVLLRLIKYFSITEPKTFEEITTMSVPELNATLRKYIDECSSNFVGEETFRYRWAKENFENMSKFLPTDSIVDSIELRHETKEMMKME